MSLLEARGLTCGYAASTVVRDLDLTVDAGEVVALLGPNGAGKTTTLMTLAGVLPALGGTVLIDDEPARGSLDRRARHGLGLLTERRAVFPALTVRENLRVGRVGADAVLDLFPELGARLTVAAGLLSGGEQQMLALGRVLARRPRLLLLDELSLGLAPLVVARLLAAVRTAADTTGVGVLLVEQHARAALRTSDRAYVMNRGRIRLHGTAAELLEKADLLQSTYLEGADGDQSSASEPVPPEPGPPEPGPAEPVPPEPVPAGTRKNDLHHDGSTSA